MKQLTATSLLVVALLCILSCKKDPLPVNPDPDPDPVDTTVTKPVDSVFKDTIYNGLFLRKGISTFLNKLDAGGNAVIGYLGGSITASSGYRTQTVQKLQVLYPKATITGINAGVGSTGSDLGVFRVEDEVLKYNPDLVFVEFAVNDVNADTMHICNAMEGIVRKIKRHNPATDICFIYTANVPMNEENGRKVEGNSIRSMQKIADHYDITSINLGMNVYDSIKANRLLFQAPADSSKTGKIVFTNDGTHPTTQGHTVYTNTIMDCFAILKKAKREQVPLRPALFSTNFETATRYRPDSFKGTDFGWRTINDDQALAPFVSYLPNLIYSVSPKDSLVINFKGTVLAFEDIMGPTSYAMIVQVNKGKKVSWMRFDKSSTTYRRKYFFMQKIPEGNHRAVVWLDPQVINKFAILNSQAPLDTALYAKNYMYISNVMLLKQ